MNINSNAVLSHWCEDARACDFLSIDTEFKWEKTYWPQLCLVQLATRESIAIIDVLADLDLNALSSLLTRDAQLKIFHAAKQDLEVLDFFGFEKLESVMDCQIAAALIGLEEQIGYGPLVSKLLDINLDKSQTRTDWTIRPLTGAQREYAANDVRYLEPISRFMHTELNKLGRLSWLREDCTQLHSNISPESRRRDAWIKVRGWGKLETAAFELLVELAAWREKLAQEKNLPRSWVLTDTQLTGLACDAPATLRQLAQILKDKGAIVRKHGDELLEITKRNNSDYVLKILRPTNLNLEQRNWVKAMKSVVKEQAQSLEISPSVLCSGNDLKCLAKGEIPLRLKSGWRRQFLTMMLE